MSEFWQKLPPDCDSKRPSLDDPAYPKFPTRPLSGRGPPIFRSILISRITRANLRYYTFPKCGPTRVYCCCTGSTGLAMEEVSQNAQRSMSYCLNQLSSYSAHVLTGTFYPLDRLLEMMRSPRPLSGRVGNFEYAGSSRDGRLEP